MTAENSWINKPIRATHKEDAECTFSYTLKELESCPNWTTLVATKMVGSSYVLRDSKIDWMDFDSYDHDRFVCKDAAGKQCFEGDWANLKEASPTDSDVVVIIKYDDRRLQWYGQDISGDTEYLLNVFHLTPIGSSRDPKVAKKVGM